MMTQLVILCAFRPLRIFLIVCAALVFGCNFDLDLGFPSGTGPTYPPTPYNGPHFQDVSFSSPNEGIAVGDGGWIARTTNGGTTWLTEQSVDGYGNYTSVSCPSPGLAWVTGPYQGVRHSADHGATWVTQVPSNYDSSFWGVHFSDGANGWAAGYARTRGGIVIATSDGGLTWDTKLVAPDDGFCDIYFLGDKAGWVVGYSGRIYHSDDGGETWQQQVSNTAETLYKVDFVDSHVGWVSSTGGTLLHTEDGGETWETLDYSITGDGTALRAFDFLTREIGWAAGIGYCTAKTVDAGLHWASTSHGSSEVSLYAVDFVDANNGWVVGTEKTILCTHNGGYTWLRQTLTF